MRYSQVFINITMHCNQRCSFCYIGRTKRCFHRPLPEILRNLDKARKLCNCDTIVLSGGEPTLHPQIFEIMDAAVNKGFKKICFFSNATRFCDKKFAKELSQHGLHSAMLSLHGSCARIHNRIVGTRHFEEALAGIENALELGVKTVINTVAVSSNMRDLPAIHRLIQERFPGALNHRITYPALMGDILSQNELIPKYEEVTKVIVSLLGKSRRVPLRSELIPFCLLGRNFKVAEELYVREGAGLAFDGVGSHYNRIGGQPCLQCQFKRRCYGMQFEAVQLFGVPISYGKTKEAKNGKEHLAFCC